MRLADIEIDGGPETGECQPNLSFTVGNAVGRGDTYKGCVEMLSHARSWSPAKVEELLAYGWSWTK